MGNRLCCHYITSPRSRQGWGLVVFSLTIYIFRQRWYNNPRGRRGQPPKGGDRMTVIEVCTLIALVIDAILLGMAIQSRK